MSRNFLAAIRSAIFPTSEIAAEIEVQPVSIAATTRSPTVLAQPVPPTPTATATHPSNVQDMQGRFATIAKAEGIAGSAKRLPVALQLAAEAPDMSTEAIIGWVTTYVPAADKPARTIPTLIERAEEAQRMADSLGASTDSARNGWDAAVDEAHRRHKIN